MTKYISFILSLSQFKQLEARKLLRPCQGCGKKFKAGDQIISVKARKVRWYCLKCAVKHGII